MTPPTGNLIRSIKQRKDATTRSFIIWLVLTLAITALILVIGASSPEFNFGILIFALFPAAIMVYEGIKVDQPARLLEIYSDGFVIRNSRTDEALDEVRWTEVRDITLSENKSGSQFALVASMMFGLLGALIASMLSPKSESNDMTDILIQLENKRRIKIDTSYSDPTRPHKDLKDVVIKAWLNEAAKTLKRGKSIIYNDIELMPTGLKQGKKSTDWDSIENISYVGETGNAHILYRNAGKKKQEKIKVTGSFRGKALIQIVNRILGKRSLSSKLGRL